MNTLQHNIRAFFMRSTGFPVLALLLFPASFCAMPGCATRAPEPDTQFETSYMEKQLSEMDKKLEEIYHRVSVIQFMVDNHERMIRDLGGMNISAPGTTPYPQGSMGQQAVSEPSTPEPFMPFAGSAAPANPSDTSRQPAVQEPVKRQVLYASPDARQAASPSRPAYTSSPEFSDAAQPYNLGREAYKVNDFDRAITYFDRVVRDFPGHDLADNALYWKGESLYAQKKFDTAIDSFRRVATEYPDGGKVPDALLKTGYAYLALGDTENAKLFLRKVARTYPFTQAGTKAQAKLKEFDSP